MVAGNMDRREQILRHVPLTSGLGLEIGPLDSPLVTHADAPVLYVDHASTEDLEAKYADDPEVDHVVPVDVVWGDRRLRDALGERRAHWAVASHIIEHVPNLMGWLAEIGEVLVPGGVLSLAVPDKRFSFDAKRRETDVSDFVEAALTERTRHTVAATYDFWARILPVDTAAVWAGTGGVDEVPDNRGLGLEKSYESLKNADYRDVHGSVFTPQSMLEVLNELVEMDLLPAFEILDLEPTQANTLEFFLALRWLGADRPRAERHDRQATSIQVARRKLESAPRPLRANDDQWTAALSPKEVRLVQLKRQALRRMRSALGVLRGKS